MSLLAFILNIGEKVNYLFILRFINGHTALIKDLKVDDNNWLISASEDKNIIIWNFQA